MAVSSVANSETFKVTTPSDVEISVTRLFDAPRHLVFEALHTPEHIQRWWGILGEGYSVPECEIDFRPGGKWRFVNQTPDGGSVTFYGEFQEITPPDRVVYTEIYEPYPDGESVITETLTEENGKTRVTLSCVYPSREVRDMVIGSGMEFGAALSYDRLEEVAKELERA